MSSHIVELAPIPTCEAWLKETDFKDRHTARELILTNSEAVILSALCKRHELTEESILDQIFGFMAMTFGRSESVPGSTVEEAVSRLIWDDAQVNEWLGRCHEILSEIQTGLDSLVAVQRRLNAKKGEDTSAIPVREMTATSIIPSENTRSAGPSNTTATKCTRLHTSQAAMTTSTGSRA